jgi:hypothetical protein
MQGRRLGQELAACTSTARNDALVLAGGRQGRAVDDRDGERLAALGTGAEPRPRAMLVTRGAAVLALEPDQPPHLARTRLT